jgi:uncharacterized protein (UPF0335 family)
MGKTTAGPISKDRLKSFIECIEKLIEERSAIGSDIRDVFSEAKGVGYNVKIMRKLIQIRAQDQAERDELNALLDTYAHALDMEVGTFAREPSEDELMDRASDVVDEVEACMSLIGPKGEPPPIAAICKLTGCSTGKASKLRSLVMKRQAATISRSGPIIDEMKSDLPPHDPATGELIEAAATTEEITLKTTPVSIQPQPQAWKEITSARDAHEARIEAEHQQRLAEARRRKQEAIDEARRLADENRRIDEDDLAIPAFLKKQPEGVTA